MLRASIGARQTGQVHDFEVTKRRLGGWLLVAALVLVCVGGVVWNGEHARSRTVVGPMTCSTDVSGSKVGMQSEEIITGPAPSHAPAIWLLVIGGVVGGVGAFLISKVTPVPGGDDRPDSD